jgi:hypothetical protein
VQGDTPSHATAQRLVSDSVIRKRHEIPALMALEAEEVRPQERWSNIRTLTFGMMGAKAYERIYTLAEVQQQDGRQVAVVKMEAIPSAVAAGQLHTSQPVNPFGSMFDSTGTYEGHLKIDLGAGAVTEYVERMDVQWVAADTLGAQEVGSGPAVIKMSATELYELERIE